MHLLAKPGLRSSHSPQGRSLLRHQSPSPPEGDQDSAGSSPQVLRKCHSLSRVQLFVAPWTVAHQIPLSIGFSRPEHWSGLPFPSPGDLSNPEMESGSPALQADSLPSESEANCSFLNRNFPGGSDGKASACNVGDLGSVPGLGRSPGEGNGNPLH